MAHSNRSRTVGPGSKARPRRDRTIDRAQPVLTALSEATAHDRATESSHRTAACTSACSQPRPPYVPVLDIFPIIESPPRKPRLLKSTVTIPRLGSGELIKRRQAASRQPISDSGSCFQPRGISNVFTGSRAPVVRQGSDVVSLLSIYHGVQTGTASGLQRAHGRDRMPERGLWHLGQRSPGLGTATRSSGFGPLASLSSSLLIMETRSS